MEEFPSNSRAAKKAELLKTTEVLKDGDNKLNGNEAVDPKKVEKLVTGPVIRRKKPLGKRFMETFVGGDIKGVWNYILFDVLIPAAKDMATDAISQGIEKMLYGETRPGNRRSGIRSNSNQGYISYNRYSSRDVGRREDPRPTMSRRARASHDFDEIILATRAEAEEIIDRLFDLVSRYEAATVSDLYELVGVSGNYTDERWGWKDIRGAGVTRVNNGYLLDLPKPEHLD